MDTRACGELLDECDLVEVLPGITLAAAATDIDVDLAVRVNVLPLKIDSSSFMSSFELDGLNIGY